MLFSSGFVDDVTLSKSVQAWATRIGCILKVTHRGSTKGKSLLSTIALWSVLKPKAPLYIVSGFYVRLLHLRSIR